MAKKLLVADDSITIQKVVSLTFANEDIVIHSVSNGDQALEKIRSEAPDVVLADVFMPGRNGYEVCAAIKGDPALSKIPVVLLVGTFEPFDEAEATRVKCDGHLTKPFDTTELLELVHSLIEHGPLKPRATEKLGRAAGATSPSSPLVSPRTRESFLGNQSILELFGAETKIPTARKGSLQTKPARAEVTALAGGGYPTAVPKPSSTASEEVSPPPQALEDPAKLAEAANPQVIPFPGSREAPSSSAGPQAVSDELINAIVENVIRRLSDDLVREIVWEVVPELAEIRIREYLNERGIPAPTMKPGS